MQGTWLARRKRLNKWIIFAISIAILCLSVLFDQLTKIWFERLYIKNGTTTVIDGFFYFALTKNSGAGWGIFSDVSWGQLFFKILTPIALLLFILVFVWAFRKNYKVMQFGIALSIGGTIGNYIDRLRFEQVTDFISFVFGDFHFPVFNLADICLTVGVFMIIIHLLFLDDNAVFRKRKKCDDLEGNNDAN
ncbi:MAG: signal peptidase II [Clostridia bacterium]|nr:signal peptidase II [Clostridia bacterium]